MVVTGPHFNSVGTRGMISPVPFHYKAVARGHNTRGRTSPPHCGVGTRYNARHYANQVCPAVQETAVLGFIISSPFVMTPYLLGFEAISGVRLGCHQCYTGCHLLYTAE
jgi:hypothetical protein